jgi:hypothetical protein
MKVMITNVMTCQNMHVPREVDFFAPEQNWESHWKVIGFEATWCSRCGETQILKLCICEMNLAKLEHHVWYTYGAKHTFQERSAQRPASSGAATAQQRRSSGAAAAQQRRSRAQAPPHLRGRSEPRGGAGGV